MPKPFEVGKTYKTRDGRDARVICIDRMGQDYPLVVLVMQPYEKAENALSYPVNGKWAKAGVDSPLDLIPDKEKIEGWLRVWRVGNNLRFGDIYATEHQAAHPLIGEAAGAIKIEYEE